jgi:hypothetical protein
MPGPFAEKVRGARLFRDSQLPARSSFENLEAGTSIEDFLEMKE